MKTLYEKFTKEEIDSLFGKLSNAYKSLSNKEKTLLREIYPLGCTRSTFLFDLLKDGFPLNQATLSFALQKVEDYVDAEYLNFCHEEKMDPVTGESLV